MAKVYSYRWTGDWAGIIDGYSTPEGTSCAVEPGVIFHTSTAVDTEAVPLAVAVENSSKRTTKATHKQYRHSSAVTDLIEFPDRGHSLTVDGGWREVATTSIAHGRASAWGTRAGCRWIWISSS